MTELLRQARSVVLNTKLYRPKPPQQAVVRPRLADELNQCLKRKLAIVSAPAGYGKTTLVSQWLDTVRIPSAWVSLDEQDGDLITFVSYLVAAITLAHPATALETPALLQSPYEVPLGTLADTLIIDMDNLPASLIIVLDDYHLVESEAVNALVERLIRYATPRFHLVIVSRTQPNLALSRLRMDDQMLQLTAGDLAFRLPEAADLLTAVSGRPILPQTVEMLETSTEGWVAGLQLAGITLRGMSSSELQQQVGGYENRLIAEYLAEQVASRIPPDVRDFLLRISVLDEFNADLCAALAEPDEAPAAARATAVSTIRQLQQANLFIVALDDRQEWFRFHHLFRDTLRVLARAEFDVLKLGVLQRRAGAWFAERGRIQSALRFYLAAGDSLAAAQLVEANYHAVLDQEDWRRLERWLQQLPAEMKERPTLLVAQAFMESIRFRLGTMMTFLERAQSSLDGDTTLHHTVREGLQAEIFVLRSLFSYWAQENPEATIHAAEAALSKVDPKHKYARSTAELYYVLGLAASGRVTEALTLIQAGVRSHHADNDIRTMRLLIGECAIGIATNDISGLRRTAETFHQLASAAGRLLSIPWANWVHGYAAYESNDLATAEGYFREVLRSPFSAHVKAVAECFAGLCLVYLAQARMALAGQTLDQFRHFMSAHGQFAFLRVADSLERRIALTDGDVSTLLGKDTLNPDQFENLNLVRHEYPPLMHVAVLIRAATPDHLTQATGILAEARRRAANIHDEHRLSEIGALQALCCAAAGDEAGALAALEDSLNRAARGRLIRLYLDRGPDLVPLLVALRKQGKHTAYINELVAAFAGDSARSRAAPVSGLLTNREMDVLELLARRMSNKQIAAELVLSPMTVKRHIQNLSQKLGATNRREVVALARQKNLLS